MSEIIRILGLFLMIISIHELGHWILFYNFTKIPPPMKISKFGNIFIGYGKYLENVTLKEVAITAYAGILAGLLPFMLLEGNFLLYMLIIYIFMCANHFYIIMIYLENKEYKNSICANLQIIDQSKYPCKKPASDAES